MFNKSNHLKIVQYTHNIRQLCAHLRQCEAITTIQSRLRHAVCVMGLSSCVLFAWHESMAVIPSPRTAIQSILAKSPYLFDDTHPDANSAYTSLNQQPNGIVSTTTREANITPDFRKHNLEDKNKKQCEAILAIQREAQVNRVNGHLTHAIQLMQQAITQNTQAHLVCGMRQTIALQYDLAQLHLMHQQPISAIHILEHTLTLDANNPVLLLLLVNAHCQLGDFNTALQLLNTIPTDQAHQFYSDLLRGKIYLNLGLYRAAVPIYQRIVEAHGELAQGWLGLAIAFQGLGNNRNAKSAHVQALTQGIANAAVVNYIQLQLESIRHASNDSNTAE